MACWCCLRTLTSYKPVRPPSATSVASAVRWSPSCAGARKSMSRPLATVRSLRELQAKANAEWASTVMKPPGQMSKPLSMSARTTISSVACPCPRAVTRMPRPRVARSLASMPLRTWSATAWGLGLSVEQAMVCSTLGETRGALAGEGRDAFAVIGTGAQRLLHGRFLRQRLAVVQLRRSIHGLARGHQRLDGHGGQALRQGQRLVPEARVLPPPPHQAPTL